MKLHNASRDTGPAAGGWERLYGDHVGQAGQVADLDFLFGSSGHQLARESHGRR